MERKLVISVGASRTSKNWKNREYTWAELKQKLAGTTRTEETVAQYHAAGKKDQDAIKDIGGFVGGSIKGKRRITTAVEYRSLVTLDADFADEDMVGYLELLAGYECVIYSTHKHTSEKPRLRVVLPLKRDITTDEYGAVARALAAEINIECFDDTTYQPQRLMYWPSTPSDGEYVFKEIPGEWVDPDAVLRQYRDWTDVSSWPYSTRVSEAIHKHAGGKQADPTGKSGVIGAFCRTYSIERAIEKYLPDIYVPDGAGRYTYAPGTTTGGAVVYDDGKFLYSHHSTDPCCGQLLNAFDMVRLHKFGEADENAEPGTPVNRLPSFKEMTELAQQDDEVRVRLIQERFNEAGEDFKLSDDKWETSLNLDSKGFIKNTRDNALIILEHDPNLKGRIAINDFESRMKARGDLPWRRIKDNINGDVWKDADDSELLIYMERYGNIARDKVFDALNATAGRQRFHPVRDYLGALKWDGVERLSRLFVDKLGASNDEYVCAATRKTFVGAVKRVMEPGCKFDYMPVLVGPQGIGKSSLIRDMGGSWFTDGVMGIGTKEALEQIQGFWIVEMAELAALRKTEIEPIKLFVSTQVDSYRAAYGRRREDHPRQCIFIGTTNSDAFLRDDTGNRRFWPIAVNKKYSGITMEEREQLWAEAVFLYKKGEVLYLSPELEEQAALQQELFEIDDPWAQKFIDYLDRPLPEDWYKWGLYERRNWLNDDFGGAPGDMRREAVSIRELWTECLGGDEKLIKQNMAALHSSMRKVPGWERSNGKVRIGGGAPQRAYVRCSQQGEN